MKKTYKEQWLERLKKETLRQDRLANNWKLSKFERWHSSTVASRLRDIRDKAMILHGKHFIPSRFPSPEFISLSMSLNDINKFNCIDHIHEINQF